MIEYRDSVEGIGPEHLTGFFVGWPSPPSPETHLRILRGSSHVVLAWDTETQCVAGFINAVSDGVLSAYIPLLEVLPQYQRRGIGGELAKRLIACLRNYYMVDLVCDASVQPFYDRLGVGFQRASAMIVRNRAAIQPTGATS